MITRIKIDGFKSFSDFEVEFAPFTVIAGPNGSGKSNLFDALQLLKDLTVMPVMEAFSRQRGTASELFTILADGSTSSSIYFEVDLLLDNDSGESLQCTRVSYALEIKRVINEAGIPALEIGKERLVGLLEEEDTWAKKYLKGISYKNPASSHPILLLERFDTYYKVAIEEVTSDIYDSMLFDNNLITLQTSISVAQTFSAHSVVKALNNWKFLDLKPTQLKAPNPIISKTEIGDDGSNLVNTLYRIQQSDKRAYKNITRQLSMLLPSFKSLSIKEDTYSGEYRMKVTSTEQQDFSVRLLSDGTLRLIALCTLCFDPIHRGLICLEEPENGIPPSRLIKMLHLLKATVDNSDRAFSSKQIIINTHSPVLISEIIRQHPDIHLLYTNLVTKISKGIVSKITLMTGVKKDKVTSTTTSEEYTPVDTITTKEVLQYLMDDNPEQPVGL